MDMELQNFLRNEPKGIEKRPREPEVKAGAEKTEKRRRPPLELWFTLEITKSYYFIMIKQFKNIKCNR